MAEYEVTVRVTQVVTVVVAADSPEAAQERASHGPAAWIDTTLGTTSAETVEWRATSRGRVSP